MALVSSVYSKYYLAQCLKMSALTDIYMQSTYLYRIGLTPPQGQGSSVRHHVQPDHDNPFFFIQSIRDYFPRFYPFKTNLKLNYKDPVRTAQ